MNKWSKIFGRSICISDPKWNVLFEMEKSIDYLITIPKFSLILLCCLTKSCDYFKI